MRILLGVKSCQRDIYTHEHIRPLKPAADFDLQFFVGGEPISLKGDEILLPCKDDYSYLVHKTQEMIRWSLQPEHDYDYTFFCDNDTFDFLWFCGSTRLERIFSVVNIPFREYDYVGYFGSPYPMFFAMG